MKLTKRSELNVKTGKKLMLTKQRLNLMPFGRRTICFRSIKNKWECILFIVRKFTVKNFKQRHKLRLLRQNSVIRSSSTYLNSETSSKGRLNYERTK